MTEATEAPAETTAHAVVAPAPPSSPRARHWPARLGWTALGLVIGVLLCAPAIATEDDRLAPAERKANRIEARATAKAERIVGDAVDEKNMLAAEAEDLGVEKTQVASEVELLKNELGLLNRKKATSTFEGDGMYLVGADVRPGTYRAAASPGCYYAVLANLSGAGNDIITNGNVDGPVVFTVPSSAKGVEVQRCGTFTRVTG